MTRSLRQWHRVIITALAVALTVLFVSALIVRRPAPINPRLPDAVPTPNSHPPSP